MLEVIACDVHRLRERFDASTLEGCLLVLHNPASLRHLVVIERLLRRDERVVCRQLASLEVFVALLVHLLERVYLVLLQKDRTLEVLFTPLRVGVHSICQVLDVIRHGVPLVVIVYLLKVGEVGLLQQGERLGESLLVLDGYGLGGLVYLILLLPFCDGKLQLLFAARLCECQLLLDERLLHRELRRTFLRLLLHSLYLAGVELLHLVVVVRLGVHHSSIELRFLLEVFGAALREGVRPLLHLVGELRLLVGLLCYLLLQTTSLLDERHALLSGVLVLLRGLGIELGYLLASVGVLVEERSLGFLKLYLFGGEVLPFAHLIGDETELVEHLREPRGGAGERLAEALEHLRHEVACRLQRCERHREGVDVVLRGLYAGDNLLQDGDERSEDSYDRRSGHSLQSCRQSFHRTDGTARSLAGTAEKSRYACNLPSVVSDVSLVEADGVVHILDLLVQRLNPPEKTILPELGVCVPLFLAEGLPLPTCGGELSAEVVIATCHGVRLLLRDAHHVVEGLLVALQLFDLRFILICLLRRVAHRLVHSDEAVPTFRYCFL